MGRKSRHSAKTGDTSLYKSRSAPSSRIDNSDDDAMYNEVERHYNKHVDNNDYLRLDDGGEESEEDDGVTTRREGVFDLGMASDDEDDQESSEDSEQNDDDAAPLPASSDDESLDDDSEDEPETNVFNWGSKKHSYYHGDTADLEIGQDEEDAILEEEAGKEVQMARLEGMEEGDFMLDDRVGSLNEEKDLKKKSKRKKEKSDMSRKDKMKLMKASHPELMPVIDHFRGGLEDFVETTAVVGDALFRADGSNEAEVRTLVCFVR
jgi:U3 small nucleolar RNA-associated protein 3